MEDDGEEYEVVDGVIDGVTDGPGGAGGAGGKRVGDDDGVR